MRKKTSVGKNKSNNKFLKIKKRGVNEKMCGREETNCNLSKTD
jgi:hypothetical protein